MKNKSFVGIYISKNVIDVSIFREDTNIKMFPHEVFNNTRKGFGDMCSWLKKSPSTPLSSKECLAFCERI